MTFTYGVSIDWLTITGSYPQHVQRHGLRNSMDARAFAISMMGTLFKEIEFSFSTQGSGRFYEWYFEDTGAGVRVDISSRAGQGWMLQLRGTWCRSNTELVAPLIEGLRGKGCKITRCDVAIDLFGSDVKPRDIFEDLRPSKGETSRRKLDFITSSTGETLAVGSRDSRFYARFYDKGAEQGVDFHWLRAELEIKQDAAHRLVEIPVNATIRGAAAKMLDMVEGHVSEVTEALSIVADGLSPLSSHSRPDQPATERWLMETVLPAMRRLAKEDQAAFTRVMNAFEGLSFG